MFRVKSSVCYIVRLGGSVERMFGKNVYIHMGVGIVLAILVIFGSLHIYNNIISTRRYESTYNALNQEPTSLPSYGSTMKSFKSVTGIYEETPILLIYVEYPAEIGVNKSITFRIAGITIVLEDNTTIEASPDRIIMNPVTISPGEKILVSALPMPVSRIVKIIMYLGDTALVGEETIKLNKTIVVWEGVIDLYPSKSYPISFEVSTFI